MSLWSKGHGVMAATAAEFSGSAQGMIHCGKCFDLS